MCSEAGQDNFSITTNKICVATIAHNALDTRIYFKQIMSLSKSYIVDYYGRQVPQGTPKPSGKFIPLSPDYPRQPRIRTNYILFKLLKNSSYRIYHLHDPELIPLGLFLKLRGKAVIFDMHEDISKQVINKEWIPSIFRWPLSFIFSVIERCLPKIFDCVILAEDSYLQKFKSVKNIQVIHNYPFGQEFIKKTYDFNTFRIVYVGDLRAVRGIKEYLKILKKCRDNNLDIELVLIGSYADTQVEKECMDLIKSFNIESRVTHHGRLPNNDVYEILRECDLGLALLHPIGNYVSSYPTKLFEYMSVGLPVLTSNFELWKAIVEGHNCGYTVDPFDVDAAVSAITNYYNNTDLLCQHGRNGLNFIQKEIMWEKEEEKLVRIYEGLLGVSHENNKT